MPGISAMADGTTSTGPDVRSHVESLTKMTLITAAPINVAPGKANPYSNSIKLRIVTQTTPPSPIKGNRRAGELNSTANDAAETKEPIICAIEKI